MPPPREETIGELLRRLTGAPRIMKLNKWLGWLRDLTPEGVDPAQLWGRPLREPEDSEKVITEICGLDLTESECYNKLLQWSRGARVTGRLGRDYQRYFEAQSAKIARIERELGLEGIPIDPSLAEELEGLIKRGATVEEILDTLKSYFKRYYADVYTEEELNQEWAKIEATIKPRLQEALERLAPIDWRDVLEPTILRPEDKYPWLRRYFKEFKDDIREAKKAIAVLTAQNDIIVVFGAQNIAEETGFQVFKIADIKAFKDIGIEDAGMLYDAMTKSRLLEIFRKRVPEAQKIVIYRYSEWGVNFIIDSMKIGEKFGIGLYYTLDPLMCYIQISTKKPILCNQWVFIMYYNPIFKMLVVITI